MFLPPITLAFVRIKVLEEWEAVGNQPITAKTWRLVNSHMKSDFSNETPCYLWASKILLTDEI